jgi:hypothetical protein
MKNKICKYIVIGILCLWATHVVHWQSATRISTVPSVEDIQVDTTLLFPKIVLPNRLEQFRHYLQALNIRADDNYELLLLLSNPNMSHQLTTQFQINSDILLMHAELADLMQIHISEMDAQLLHFSQRNYQNPFDGTTMNLQILANADAERLLEDMGGGLAGNENTILQNYCLSIEEVESWINQAKEWNNNKITFFGRLF